MPPFRTLAIFLLLSLADLGVTWGLLHQAGEEVYESNPIARWWLEQCGWPGLVGFKAVTVLVAAGLCLLISRRRQQLGRVVLRFGCLAVACVVAYSCYLAYLEGIPFGDSSARQAAAAEDRERLLEQECVRLHQFLTLRSQLSLDLIAGRCMLDEAARRLTETEIGADAAYLRRLATALGSYSSEPFTYSDEQCLAASLVRDSMLELAGKHALAHDVAGRLLGQFRASYQVAPPWSLSELLQMRRNDPLPDALAETDTSEPGVAAVQAIATTD